MVSINDSSAFANADAASVRDEFGLRLTKLFGALGISQNEFARGIGASSAFVSNMARGIKKPGMEFLTRVAQQYGVSLDWLVLGNGSMFGESLINIDLLVSVQMRVALAYRAEVQQDVEVKALIDDLLGTPEAVARPKSQNMSQLLGSLAKAQQQQEAVGAIYNKCVAIQDEKERLKAIMQASIEWYRAQSADPLTNLISQHLPAPDKADSAADSVTQVNIGQQQRNIGLNITRPKR